jgi:hypothetical protein
LCGHLRERVEFSAVLLVPVDSQRWILLIAIRRRRLHTTALLLKVVSANFRKCSIIYQRGDSRTFLCVDDSVSVPDPDRIRNGFDPDSIRSVDPYPDPDLDPGLKKITHNNREKI